MSKIKYILIITAIIISPQLFSYEVYKDNIYPFIERYYGNLTIPVNVFESNYKEVIISNVSKPNLDDKYNQIYTSRYTYNDNGLVQSFEKFNLTDGEYIKVKGIYYKFDDQNLKVINVYTDDEVSRYVPSYNSRNQLAELKIVENNNFDTIKYSYDYKGNLISFISKDREYSYKDYVLIARDLENADYTVLFEYNDIYITNFQIEYIDESNSLVHISKRFNESGQRISSSRIANKQSEHNQFIYEYDDEGYVSKYFYVQSDDSLIFEFVIEYNSPLDQQIYIYNKDGDLTTQYNLKFIEW